MGRQLCWLDGSALVQITKEHVEHRAQCPQREAGEQDHHDQQEGSHCACLRQYLSRLDDRIGQAHGLSLRGDLFACINWGSMIQSLLSALATTGSAQRGFRQQVRLIVLQQLHEGQHRIRQMLGVMQHVGGDHWCHPVQRPALAKLACRLPAIS